MVIALIIPLLIFLLVGIPGVIVIFKLLNSPIIAGQIPVWSLVVIIVLGLWLLNKFRKWGVIKPRNQQYAQMRYR